MAETPSLGFANGYPVIAADIGNGLIKMGGWVRGRRQFVSGTHACVEIDEARYARLTEERQNDKGHYEYIKWKNRCYVVGAAALSEGKVSPVQGQNKYRKDYYGIMFISTLLRLYQGNPPEDINAYVGFPPPDAQWKTNLLKSVLGDWEIDNLGRKKHIRVHFAAPWDEIVGGVKNVTHADDGSALRPNMTTKTMTPSLIAVDGPSIVVDLGYGTFDVLRLNKTGQPDYTQIGGRRIGIGNAIEDFTRVFNHRHKKYLEDAEDGISLERVYDCFYDSKHQVRIAGQTFVDCMDIYKSATQRLINAVTDAFREMSRGSISYNYCLLTGGGSGLLYNELCKQVFPQFAEAGAIFLAHKADEMHLANVSGAMKMVPGLIDASQRRARAAGSGQ